MKRSALLARLSSPLEGMMSSFHLTALARLSSPLEGMMSSFHLIVPVLDFKPPVIFLVIGYTAHMLFRLLPLPSATSVFCVPGHARSSVRRVRRSHLSAAVSQPIPKASCGHPPDWAISGVSKRRSWGRTAGCGCGFEELCRMDIILNRTFSVCVGGRGLDSVQFSVKRL